ncbi:hypothetical protein Plhal703r1_c57g0162471 [Plasmopara halstedii]
MTYTPEQYLANKARIMETQKRYYQRTREARLGYQKEYDDKIEIRFGPASENLKPNLVLVKPNLIQKTSLIN